MSVRGGLDLGGTKIQAVVVDAGGQVLGEARRPTPTSGGPDDVARELAASMHEASGAAGIEPAALTGVGVGSPGEIDASAGTVAQARNLPNWIHPYPLVHVLSKELDTPVSLGNDVSVATQAEFELGAGKEFHSLLGVFWGTGVGGGIVIGGALWTGRGAAGELGHVVIKEDGRRCPCGRRGCLEAYAGRASMEAQARKLHKKGGHTDLFHIMERRGRTRLTSGVWARALERDDELAVKIVDRAVKALGTGVASAVNLLDVEAVVIGGGLGVRLGQEYADRIAAAMQPHLFVDERPPVVRVAALGDLGGAIGASLLARRPTRVRRAAA
ncbi:MAG: ROK family protein [Thermoleophilaceae bacterium]